MVNILEALFKKKIPYKSQLVVTDNSYIGIVRNNRDYLNEVPDWIDDLAFSKSCFDYGVPDFIKDEINKPLNEESTYTDLMVWLAQKYFSDLNYLEIGVSVGKNFYQVIKSISRGHFTGFDIEEINPVLSEKFEFISQEDWSTLTSSLKKTPSSIKRYLFEGKKVEYLSGDVWDENSWKKLSGKKYNLVFSDALHSAEAIIYEFEMLVKYDLLADRFIIFWDDLHGRMKKAFFDIVKKYDDKFKVKDVYIIQINGWLGQHENKHPVGIISNLEIK